MPRSTKRRPRKRWLPPKRKLKSSRPNSRDNKKLNNKLFSISSISRRSKDKLKLSRTKNLRERLLWPREKDSRKKFFLELELLSLRNSRRKKLPKN